MSPNRTTLPPRKLPFSLLGHIVYDNKRPIARIHTIPFAAGDHLSEDPARHCLVSGLLDHVEFDRSALRHVFEHTLGVYPGDHDLANSLSLNTSLTLSPSPHPTSSLNSASSLDATMETSTPFGDTKPSRVLAEKCGFVGEVLDFRSNGNCVRCVDAFTKEAFWEVIRCNGNVTTPLYKGSLHMDSSHLSVISEPTVGRIIIAEKIAPEVLVMLHAALEYYFTVTTSIDLYAGYKKLGRQVQYEEMIQSAKYRSWHYSIHFLYVLSSSERLKLTPWHRKRTSVLYDDTYPAELYIGHGTTVLQLSEQHERSNTIRANASFKPWSILVLPAVPHFRQWRTHRLPTDARLANASEAWLWTIAIEHRFVYGHMADLFRHISAKVSPPEDFMFNLHHIEKLLFDDEEYTKSKLYFWAYQSLEMIQSEIKEIIRQWEEYRHKAVLFSAGISHSMEEETYKAYKSRVDWFAEQTSSWIQKFRDLIEDCKAKQREIAALRDGLFNGSAVLESRNSKQTADLSLEQTKTAIAQGENIKALTLVSIFFLPLAFVASIFGMTNLPETANMNTFGIALVCICIPAYAIIGSIMNERGMEFYRELWHAVMQWPRNKLLLHRRGALGELAKGAILTANWNLSSKKDAGDKTARDASKPVGIRLKRGQFQEERTSMSTPNPVLKGHSDPAGTSADEAVLRQISNRNQQNPHPAIGTSDSAGEKPPNSNAESPSTNNGIGDTAQSVAKDSFKGWRPTLWHRKARAKEFQDDNRNRDIEKAVASSA